MCAEERNAVTDEARLQILRDVYARGEEAAALGKDVLKAAEKQWLLRHPFTDSERIGRYASLLMEDMPAQAVVLCLFDRNKMLCEKNLLAHGTDADPQEYAPRIPDLFRKARASYAALFFAPRAAEYGYTMQDLTLASRFSQYCAYESVPLLECVVAYFGGYVPLLRLYGHT